MCNTTLSLALFSSLPFPPSILVVPNMQSENKYGHDSDLFLKYSMHLTLEPWFLFSFPLNHTRCQVHRSTNASNASNPSTILYSFELFQCIGNDGKRIDFIVWVYASMHKNQPAMYCHANERKMHSIDFSAQQTSKVGSFLNFVHHLILNARFNYTLNDLCIHNWCVQNIDKIRIVENCAVIFSNRQFDDSIQLGVIYFSN